MADPIDWSVTTFDGNRLRQQREFLALPFRRKLEILEQLGEVAEFFANRLSDESARPPARPPSDPPSSSR